MPPLVHRLLGMTFLIVSCTVSTCVLAQHPATRTSVVVHIPTPAPHMTISHTPITTPAISSRLPVGSYASGAIGAAGFRPPRRPIRPLPPVLLVYEFPFLGGSFWGANSCWWTTCDYFEPWTLGYSSISSPGPITYVPEIYDAPIVYGEERPDMPQLFLKDGTILSVSDYWLIDGQLHFTMIEQEDGEPVEHAIPFDALDLQTTVDTNTRRGFRFMLRNEPFEQYLRDHPEGPPPVLTPPRQ